MEFHGHTVAKTGPWGQGPALLQTLTILDGFDNARLDPSTGLGAHTILEDLKPALADRDAYYGHADVPPEHLLSTEYAAQRRTLIGERASHEFRPGRVPGAEPFLPPALGAAGLSTGGTGELTVTATLVLADGQPVLALGSPGGDQQTSGNCSTCCAP